MAKFRAVLRRHWLLLAITTLLGIGAGVVSARFATSDVETVYTAAQVVLANPNSGSKPLIPQDELKVTRGAVPVRATEIYQETQDDPDASTAALTNRIDTEYDSDSSSLTISSDDADPDLAQARVAAFTEAFLEITNAELQSENVRRFEELQADLESARAELTAFDETYPELTQPGSVLPNDAATQALIAERRDIQERIGVLETQVRESDVELSRILPYETLGPERPRPVEGGLVDVPTSVPVRAVLLGLFGLVLGGVVTMILERVNRRVDTRDELVEVTEIPVLAEIGHLPRKKRHSDADGSLLLEGVWAEPYRRVRSAIQFVQSTRQAAPGVNGQSDRVPAPAQVFLITSTAPGEGKSTTTALTAEAMAEVSQPTLVIGGDFRRPEVDRLLGVPRQPSLADMAQLDVQRATVDEVVHRVGDSSLYVAPAGRGTREVSGLIEAAREVAEEGRRRGATVLIDSSPLQAANDPVDLLPVVDYVVLVVRAGRTTESGLVEAIDTLRRMEARILGIVLIGTPSSGKRQSYYYDYYSPPVEEQTGGDGGQPPEPATVAEADPVEEAPGVADDARVPAGAAGGSLREEAGEFPPPAPEGAAGGSRWSAPGPAGGQQRPVRGNSMPTPPPFRPQNPSS